ncbi:hypothetical protein MUBE_09390 [Mycobacterium uberis]|uniref:GmrSD restriction endonucleases C-terminal domain-containing protein n=1 Tax=Mycobacterium uberis TaxID=2162698 RepID=A0A3E1HFW4_9MYCO|nr:HNH endonuclease family protein [Mycobacterium uberis]RFD25341.1 hypothetical protein MUBE_09390 [Mycobacterium uberis]
MSRKVVLWLSTVAVFALVVAYQTLGLSSAGRAGEFAVHAGMPRVHPGTDVLVNVVVLPQRLHRYDYHRLAFGDPWDDNNDAPLGNNGCDTREDILTRDLVDKTFVSIKRCPNAVATGTLHDPYTKKTVAFQRGAKVGESVQIDHIVPLAYAWDMGAYGWPQRQRLRFANDPANLLAVDGQANHDKSDSPPARWMPPNAAFTCQYTMQFIAVLRGYQLPLDEPSTGVLRQAATTCPTG